MGIPAEVMQILSWLPIVLILGAALVCLTHWQLSRSMWWLLAGFLGLGLVDVGFRGVDALFQAQKLALPDVAPARTTLFVVRIGCWAVILTGLIKVFADVRDRIDMQPRDDSAGNQPPWKKD